VSVPGHAPAPRPKVPPGLRPAWAEIDLGAITHNAQVLCRLASPSALCAVVKADGYGHGAVGVARAALDGGASWLAVALVEEGMSLRAAGLDTPVLLLSEPAADAMDAAIAADLTLTLYSEEGVRAAALAAAAQGVRADVHVKVDTGMHRVGVPPEGLLAVVEAVLASSPLSFAGLWTHLAVADDPDDAYTTEQLRRFDGALASLAAAGVARPPSLHSANSAAAIAHPSSRHDLVRCGIALYGCPPSAAVLPYLDAAGVGLRQALSLKAHVSYVQEVPGDERPSYGRRRALEGCRTVATVPLGYRDGIPRRFFDGGGGVLIGGRRLPLAGTVTMDQIVVDCGRAGEGEPAVRRGDEVVLIGRQGDAEITADDWASWLGTISYEVLCGIGSRVPRVILPASAGR
jgi:alanine racemase